MPRILIVAGDPGSAVLLRALLKAQGLETEFAGDADGALRLAIRQRPDAAILSGALPGGGTLATLKRMRASIHTAGIPVIIVGPGETDAAGDFIAAGAQEYLAEPVQAKALAAALTANLRSLGPPPSPVLRLPPQLAILEGVTLAGAGGSGVYEAMTRLAKRLLDVDGLPRPWSQRDLQTLEDLARIVNLYQLLERAPDVPLPDSALVLDSAAAAIPSAARVLMRWGLKLEAEEADLLLRIIDEQTARLKEVALMARGDGEAQGRKTGATGFEPVTSRLTAGRSAS